MSFKMGKENRFFSFAYKAFSLLEMVVVTAILIGLIGTVLLMMSSGFRQSSSGTERLEGSGNASFFIRNLRLDLQNATEVKLAGDKKSIAIQTFRNGESLKVEYEGQEPKVLRREQNLETGESRETFVARGNIFELEFDEFKGETKKWLIFNQKSTKTRYLVTFQLVIEDRGKQIKLPKSSIFTPARLNAQGTPAGLWKPNSQIKQNLDEVISSTGS